MFEKLIHLLRKILWSIPVQSSNDNLLPNLISSNALISMNIPVSLIERPSVVYSNGIKLSSSNIISNFLFKRFSIVTKNCWYAAISPWKC